MKKAIVILLGAALVAAFIVTAWAQMKGISLPKDWKSYRHIGSLIITDKDSPLFGIHHFYMNKKGVAAFQKGEPYPDGTAIVDTVYEVDAASDGKMLNEGKMRFIPFMKKDSKAKEAQETGGWIFAAFDPQGKVMEMDVKKGCFDCHAAMKDSDYVFSKPLK